MSCSGGSRNFRTGGWGLEFLRFGNCFDIPSHTPHDFVLREENEIRIVELHINYNESVSTNFTDN